jgi:formylglycine-generating enzyme required for sulfatase activity
MDAELRSMAEQGVVSAQARLGVMYAEGEGVPQDHAEAGKWLRKAAEQGYAEAQSNLGVLYGKVLGVPRDYAEAVKWWRKAANQGFADAQFFLGVAYGRGEGVTKDYVEAYMWCLLAKNQGQDRGEDILASLEDTIPPDQIAEAKKRASGFRPTETKFAKCPQPTAGANSEPKQSPNVTPKTSKAGDLGNRKSGSVREGGLDKFLTVDLAGGVTMEFVLISPGSFMMGSDIGEDWEKPVHKVTITKPFYMARYLVTQEQWQIVMGGNPSEFKGPELPVETVSWNHCQNFLAKLQENTGRKFGLPTEAQWEYACRAGTNTKYSFGDDATGLADHGWFDGNSSKRTHPVGKKKSNPWGLYDMHGNVYEWCADAAKYEAPYSSGDVIDPQGVSGSFRVVRGGGWGHDGGHCRSAFREFLMPGCGVSLSGIRLILALDQP